MSSKTKLFIVGYFMPSWVASLLMWGDDRTSSGFEIAPPWFYYAKFVLQVLAILLLFTPLKLRSRPSLIGLAMAGALILSTFFATPMLEAEFILLNSSVQMGLLAVFLIFAQPSATLERSDLRLLFVLFSSGFLLQIILFVWFGRMPSHSISDVFIRFNGITNDSLSASLLLPLLVPWAVRTSYGLIKAGTLISVSILTGSLFGAIFVPMITLVYAIYCRLYRFAATLIVGMIVAASYLYNVFAAFIELKFLSILTHLRFILNLIGAEYQQPSTSCSEEFCESFLEAGFYLSPIYMMLVYAVLLRFIVPLMRSNQPESADSLIRDTLRVFGISLIVASFVHPVPLIPFAIPLFLILTSLNLGTQGLKRATAACGRRTRAYS